MRIFPHLWFESQAEDATAFYTSVFKHSKVLEQRKLPDPELSVVRFELEGLPITALNAHSHAYNEAFSFQVETEDQAETDYYWNALTADGGEERPCGWLTDKFGVYWQVTPSVLPATDDGSGPGKGPACSSGHVPDEEDHHRRHRARLPG